MRLPRILLDGLVSLDYCGNSKTCSAPVPNHSATSWVLFSVPRILGDIFGTDPRLPQKEVALPRSDWFSVQSTIACFFLSPPLCPMSEVALHHYLLPRCDPLQVDPACGIHLNAHFSQKFAERSTSDFFLLRPNPILVCSPYYGLFLWLFSFPSQFSLSCHLNHLNHLTI